MDVRRKVYAHYVIDSTHSSAGGTAFSLSVSVSCLPILISFEDLVTDGGGR